MTRGKGAVLQQGYDVVICGFGGAGAAAAIEAHDAGASVLVAEKAHEGGGSTQESGGSLASILDQEGAVEHYAALTEGRTPRDVVEAYVAGVMELPTGSGANGGELEPLPMWRPPFPHRYEGTAYATMPRSDSIGRRLRVAEPVSSTAGRRCGASSSATSTSAASTCGTGSQAIELAGRPTAAGRGSRCSRPTPEQVTVEASTRRGAQPAAASPAILSCCAMPSVRASSTCRRRDATPATASAWPRPSAPTSGT